MFATRRAAMEPLWQDLLEEVVDPRQSRPRDTIARLAKKKKLRLDRWRRTRVLYVEALHQDKLRPGFHIPYLQVPRRPQNRFEAVFVLKDWTDLFNQVYCLNVLLMRTEARESSGNRALVDMFCEPAINIIIGELMKLACGKVSEGGICHLFDYHQRTSQSLGNILGLDVHTMTETGNDMVTARSRAVHCKKSKRLDSAVTDILGLFEKFPHLTAKFGHEYKLILEYDEVKDYFPISPTIQQVQRS